jgi:hypothetical protein
VRHPRHVTAIPVGRFKVFSVKAFRNRPCLCFPLSASRSWDSLSSGWLPSPLIADQEAPSEVVPENEFTVEEYEHLFTLIFLSLFWPIIVYEDVKTLFKRTLGVKAAITRSS